MAGTFYRNAGTGVVAAFGPEYAPLGRLELATATAYEVFRLDLMDDDPAAYIPPAEMGSVTSLSPAVWAIVCGMYDETGA